jgi:uncharacterized protein YcbX
MTIAEARLHFKARVVALREERNFLYRGAQDKEVWASNQGTDMAFDALNDLIAAYTRVLKVIDTEEQREKDRNATTWTHDSLEGK